MTNILQYRSIVCYHKVAVFGCRIINSLFSLTGVASVSVLVRKSNEARNMSTFSTCPRLNFHYNEGNQTKKVQEEQLLDIYHHVRNETFEREKFYGNSTRQLSAHVKHQQDLKKSIKCDIKLKENAMKSCSMGTGQNKARDLTFLGNVHEQVM